MTDLGRFQCLIVDDDPDFAGLVARVVDGEGGRAVVVGTLAGAREAIDQNRYEVVILDNRLPDGTGYSFYASLRAHLPEAVVLMVTGVPELRQAVCLTRNGLFDYLTKPIEVEALVAALGRAKRCLQGVATAGPGPGRGSELVGESARFQGALTKLRNAARHQEAIVLLLGETGTGKEVAARQLHGWTHGGETGNRPFMALNCSAVPAEMFEGELFGSERGAYTGAHRRRGGLVEAAEGGTLFLDEVGDVPLNQQSKLLRFLESREYRALGASNLRHFAGRIVAATNRDLKEESRKGRFRQDLLYRLDVVSIELPPLRERPEDVLPLADHLLTRLCEKYGRRRPRLRPEDQAELRGYSFPGNVRELRNILERSLLHAPEESAWLHLDRSWLAAAPSGSAPPRPEHRALRPLEQQEYETLKRVLAEEGGAIRRTAARLGVSHQVVLRRLQWWPELREVARSREE